MASSCPVFKYVCVILLTILFHQVKRCVMACRAWKILLAYPMCASVTVASSEMDVWLADPLRDVSEKRASGIRCTRLPVPSASCWCDGYWGCTNPGWFVGRSAEIVIERLRVRFPAGAAGEFSSSLLTLCADSYSVFVPPPPPCYRSGT